MGKHTFSGSLEEDLDNCINIFNTLETLCKITLEEKLKSVPIMLTDDALNF